MPDKPFACPVLCAHVEYCDMTISFLEDRRQDELKLITPGRFNKMKKKLQEPQFFFLVAFLFEKRICTLGEISKYMKGHTKSKNLISIGEQAGIVKSLFLHKDVPGLSKFQIYLCSSYRKCLERHKDEVIGWEWSSSRYFNDQEINKLH